MIFKALEQLSEVGGVIDTIASMNDISSCYDDIANATENLSLKNTMLALSTSNLSKEDMELILIAKGVKDEEIKQALATYNLSASQMGATGATFSLSSAFKGLAVSIKESIAAMAKWLLTNPAGWAILATGAIIGVVKVVDALNVTNEELQQKIKETESKWQELTNTVKESAKEFKNLKSQVEGIIPKYAELSQGVDQLTGQNISLSTEEYEEFLDLNNQLSELFPSLSRVYTDNGDAIVQLSGDVDTIVGSLNNLVEVQKKLANQEIADNLPEVYDKAKDLNNDYQSLKDNLLTRQEEIQKTISDLSLISSWDDLYNSQTRHVKSEFSTLNDELRMNFDGGTVEEALIHYNEELNRITTEINTISTKQQSTWASLNQSLTSWLYTDSNYITMSEDLQLGVQNAINSINWDELDFDNIDEVKDYIYNGLIYPIQNDEDVKQAFTNLFSLNPGDLNRIEIAQQLQALLDEMDIEFNVMPMVKDEQEAKQRLSNSIAEIAGKAETTSSTAEIMQIRGSTDLLKNYTKDFSMEQVEIWLEVTDATMTASEAIKAYEKYLQSLIDTASTDTFSDIFSLEDTEGKLTDLGEINQELDELQTAYTGLKSAMDSYNETGYFTLDQVQEIISYGDDYLKYLMDENGNLQLNEEALNNVAVARINEMRAKALSNLMDNLESITNEESALNYLETQLLATAQGYDDLTASRMAAWSAKALEEYGMDSTVVDGVLTSFKNQASAINEMFDNINIGSINGSLDDAASAAETDWKALLDNELTILEKQLELGLISFDEYLDKRRDLIEDYYADGKLSAAEYYEYLEKHYENQLSYMDKVINTVTRKIDKEIDKLKDKQEEIEEHYNLQIEYLEEQKTALEEANAERQRQIDLQKALYELERAQNQRTTLMYSEEKGMHYVADEGAIRDAQQEAEDAEFEIKISEIEKSITMLEEARDRELEAIDEMIERLEEYKEYWNDITTEYEERQEELLAAQILGKDWEKNILEGRLDTLEKFKDNYIAIQQAMVDAAYQAAQILGLEAKTGTITDSYTRTDLGDGNGDGNGGAWKVVDEATGDTFGASYPTESAARDAAKQLDKKKAASLGMEYEEFIDSDVPGYYVRKVDKYHTGLEQGLVGSHSFDDDFKLVQKVGLGQDEVPAILQKKEAVLTQDQISNLADGLRMPNYLQPLSSDSSLMKMVKSFEGLFEGHSPIFDNNIVKQIGDSMSKLANTISNTTNTREIHQTFNISMPNITNETAAITLMRDLESLATKKIQAFTK